MILGVNLSFAVKRWQEPKELASVCSELKVNHFQLNFDFIDPWWPEDTRNKICHDYRDAFEEKGLCFDSVFGGMADYTFPQFLGYSKTIRDISSTFRKRSIDATVELGGTAYGLALGGMTHKDAYDPEKRELIYQETIERLIDLAAYGKRKGLQDIEVEATPLFTEFPNDPDSSLRMMKDLNGKTDIPVLLFVDWGHALFKPLLKDKADLKIWLTTLKPYLGNMHLQQTDGMLDRHWDFRHTEGIVTREMIQDVLSSTGTEDKILYLEFSPAFETTDDDVLEGMKYSIEYLKPIADNL